MKRVWTLLWLDIQRTRSLKKCTQNTFRAAAHFPSPRTLRSVSLDLI